MRSVLNHEVLHGTGFSAFDGDRALLDSRVRCSRPADMVRRSLELTVGSVACRWAGVANEVAAKLQLTPSACRPRC